MLCYVTETMDLTQVMEEIPMRTYLVTGGAGFIGSNYIHYMFRKYGDTIRIINVDCLTYAGNLENLKDVENQPNYTFVKADICDSAAITKIFDENDMHDLIYVDNKHSKSYLNISVLAKGEGDLKIIALHDRHSRKDIGEFLPGGVREVTSKRQEVFFYFDPGNLKPPLNVYFSGYKTREGFKGYRLLRSLGCPFLLISEARLEGGEMYVGSKEYEDIIIRKIKEYMKWLNFSCSEVILSGLSMGTYGALYYSCDIHPFAVIAGKPLLNAGDIAANARLVRPSEFATSLDFLLDNYGDLSKDSIESFNNRFWQKFNSTKWNQTIFAISYMLEDDYDQKAYKKLLVNFKDVNLQVYGKGIHGRHNDNTPEIVTWFVDQYKRILKEKFGRDFN